MRNKIVKIVWNEICQKEARKTRKYLLIFLMIFICSIIVNAENKVIFTGEEIYNEEIGIFVMPSKENGLMAITSPYYNYAFILPYEENWTFEQDDFYYLFGNNGYKNISISIFLKDIKTDKEYLGEMKKRLIDNKNLSGVEMADIIYIDETPVLVTTVDVASMVTVFNGLKQKNFFITKTNDMARYTIHFSAILDNGEQEDFDEYLEVVARSFEVDFVSRKEI